MSVEVACPNCKAVLKAPDGMAGKTVRCKRCQTPFRVPGGPLVGESLDDAQPLSVWDSRPGTSANPFAFDEAPPAAAEPPAHQPRAAFDNPFALPATGPVADPPSVRRRAVEKSKSQYRVKAGEGSSVRPAAAGGASRKPVLIATLVGVLCAAGGAAGVYYILQSQTKPTAGSTPIAEKPAATEPQPVEEKQSSADKKQGPQDGTAKPSAANKSLEKRSSKGGGVTVTGGLKLPAFPTGAGTIVEKPKVKIPLEIEAGKVKRVLVSSSDAGIVAVIWPSFAGFKGAGAVDTVDRFSLASGQRIDRQEIAADEVSWPRACDLSPDGNKLASETPAGKLTVWNLSDKSKLLDAFDPYKAEGAGKSPGIAAVYFVDEDKVAVVSKRGAVDVWDIKSKEKAVDGVPLDGVAMDQPLADRRSLAITPDRKTVLAFAGGAVHEVPVATGKPRASLPLPRTPGAGYALAADASGSRVVVAYRATSDPGPHTVLAVARLGEAKPAMLVHLGDEAGVPVAAEWSGLDTAIVVTDKDLALLADAEVSRVVLVAKPTGLPAMQQPGASSGLHWCVVPDSADAKKAVLVGVPLPHESYFGLRDASDGNQATGLAIGAEGLGK